MCYGKEGEVAIDIFPTRFAAPEAPETVAAPNPETPAKETDVKIEVCIKDFALFSDWVVDSNGKKWQTIDYTKGNHGYDFTNRTYHYKDTNIPMYVIDKATGNPYANESKICVWIKLFGLALLTPVVHSVVAAGNMVYRIVRLATSIIFWLPYAACTGKFKECLKDIWQFSIRPIGEIPFFLVAQHLAIVWGLFVSPYDGRKLYASCERYMYDGCVCAPCFQPDPKSHLLGGDPKRQNQF